MAERNLSFRDLQELRTDVKTPNRRGGKDRRTFFSMIPQSLERRKRERRRSKKRH